MKQYASQKDIMLDIINGVEDHVHCLIRLKTVQCVADAVGVIKGESSFWINRNVIIEENFEWQKGYGVFFVSPGEIDSVRNYIYKQEIHHQDLSFENELKKLCVIK
jgi:REP element-mobilizing transposase RayT